MPSTRRRTLDGWELYENGPAEARHTVLMLPGALCSGVFYGEIAEQPILQDMHLVAATLPGYAGTSPSGDLEIETFAGQAGELARKLEADVVVGHSVGANIAIEMVAAKAFSGPVVLLAPSFSRKDEAKPLRVLDRLASVFGHLPFALALKMSKGILKGEVPEERLAPLTAELQKNDPRVLRPAMRRYLQYLDRHGSVASRLCDAGVTAWVVFGEDDEVKINAREQSDLDACPQVTLVMIPDTGHFTLNTHPGEVSKLILEAVGLAE
jgi:pimeloyl-ACP methyl ester carboxylesterase